MVHKQCKSCLLVITAVFAVLRLYGAPPEEVKKVYHKEYAAVPATLVSIENRYGDVNLINWKKDSVVIDVVVTIDYPPKFKGKELIEYITVDFSVSGNTIKAVTNIDEHFIDKWYRHDDKKKFRIDYTIHAPASINLKVLNKYGDVFINELSGHAELEIRYGYVRINRLLRGNRKPLNTLYLAYSKGNIEEAGWLMLQMKYSRLEISRGTALAGETKYSKLNIDKISSVVLESKYDTYRFGTLNNLVLSASYGSVKAEEIRKKISLETRYTGVEVGHVPAGFSSIDIDNAYGSVKVSIDEKASYYLEGNTSYCKLNYPSARINRIVRNNSAEVSGYVGDDHNAKATVTVKSKYGSVSLY
jgi:hypothetical protein